MNKIKEDYDKNKPSLGITQKMAQKPNVVKDLSRTNNLYVTDKGGSGSNSSSGSETSSSYTSSSMVSEEDAVIEPQDKATIKYLSNVKDPSSGKISQPFVIGGKNYQMVRGVTPSKEIVMAVYCHDDINESGENVIHSVEDFDKNIATPIKKLEEEQMQAKSIEQAKLAEEEKAKAEAEAEHDDGSYEGSKHFLVNRKNGNVRNFKSIKDLLAQEKLEEEDYMGVPEFKQHINKKLFGGRKKTEQLNEITPTGDEDDEQMSFKAKKLMDMIRKKIPENVISTIQTPVAKREVIAAFAEMIGVPRNGLTNLLSGLKDLSKVNPNQAPQAQQAQQQGQQVQPQPQQQQPIQERKILTKNELMESLKVTKIIKVKDIK